MFNFSKANYNLNIEELVNIALCKEGAEKTDKDAICVNTGKYTGRSPSDRFFVDEESVHNYINWGSGNLPITKENFEKIYSRVQNYIEDKELYIFDGFVGADKNYRMKIRVVNEFAFQNLFAQQLFIKPKAHELDNFEPEFTVIAVPECKAIPEIDGTNSEAFIITSFEKRIVLIGGTKYCGEIKKSLFTVMNYILPLKGILPMHCSANIGSNGDVALFFGLSGTGKTTLSADENRKLIGDDEHGWTNDGIFNFEGGCYAKCIKLSEENEPQIWQAIKFGTLLENVVIDKEGKPDYDDGRYTENTRAAYPVEYIDNAVLEGIGGIPKTIIFLTADATGVFPPISKLSKEQAMYYFMSGYTSKLAGTERGIIDPKSTFSTCFGAPFMPMRPSVYAEMLGDKMERYNTSVYLVNTGWSGGPYGIGNRVKLKYTRAMVNAAINGELENVRYVKDPVFNLNLPTECPKVPSLILNPPNIWYSIDEYYRIANKLAQDFAVNFKQFEGVNEDVANAGPNHALQEFYFA